MNISTLPCHLEDMPEIHDTILALVKVEEKLSVLNRRLALIGAIPRLVEIFKSEKNHLLHKKVELLNNILTANYQRIIKNDRHLNIV